MKKVLLTLLLIFISAPVLSAPNYDPNQKPVTYDKEMYNIKLRNRLEAEYHKKCFVQISPTHSEQICDEYSYNKYVEVPYLEQKKILISRIFFNRNVCHIFIGCYCMSARDINSYRLHHFLKIKPQFLIQ